MRVTQTTYEGKGNPDQAWPLDDKGNPIIPMVQSNVVRVGQMSGEVVANFFEFDVCFYDANGIAIQSLTRTVATPITDAVRSIVDSWKAGTNTTGDTSTLADFLLNSPEAFALAV